MKKIINAIGIGLVIVVGGAALAWASYTGAQREEEQARKLNAHVIETWENAPEDFHGHHCEFGDWCTKAYYDHLTKNK